ncbi:MAG: hypothetical protein RQ875_11340 [Vicingaceae bacterium]|nr:hypothetical protein [Vicingaceae bacterium]
MKSKIHKHPKQAIRNVCKKIIYGVSFLALIGITAVGCQKENINPVSSFSTEKSSNDDNNTNQKVGNLYHLVQNFPDLGDIGCYKPAENCLPEFIVRGRGIGIGLNEPKESLIALKNAMSASSNGNGQQLSSFFSSQEWREIFPRMKGEIAQKLATGDLKITSRMATNSPGVEIFIVLPQGSDLNNFTDSEVVVAMQIKDESL